ncbi:MAG: FG-GAP-like repeat-containing protein [Candidatus Adiutrix sp.]|nr:FG-GAP-like repeat-containing protein [Candidatus Adiutrix sp.]
MKISKPVLLFAVLCLLLPTAAAADDDPPNKRHPAYSLTGRDAPSATSPLNPNFVVTEEARLSESGFWSSPWIPETLVGLSVADLDQDGRNEVIYASSRNVYVAQVNGQRLDQLARYSLPPTETIISLDTFDLAGDGRPLIICSSQNDKKFPAAFILRYGGGELTPVSSNIPWFLRVVGAPGGRFLAGQKGGSTRTDFYSGSVMRMNFDGSGVKSAGQVGLPPFVNLFNFTLGRLGSGGAQVVAAIKFPSEHIFLFDGQTRETETREEYAGTMNYIVAPGAGDNERREYLPARILIADIDGDGQNELIVAKNDRGGVPFMGNQRGFSSGAMQAFKYVNLSLSPFFRSRALPGPGVDYALADFNNDGTPDLVVAVVTEHKSGLLKDGRSRIVAYEIGRPAGDQ